MRLIIPSRWVEALQASGAVPDPRNRLTPLLAGTALVLLALALISLPPEVKTEAEAPATLLSYYVEDTEFLNRCVALNQCAIERSDYFAPEIKAAVLQLAGAGH